MGLPKLDHMIRLCGKTIILNADILSSTGQGAKTMTVKVNFY